MRFHDQYKNTFEEMPPKSKVDMLKILKTGDDPISKLKGQRLLDKASEYVALLDKPYSKESAVVLIKYNDLIIKFNPIAEDVLVRTLSDRLPKNHFKFVYAAQFLAEAKERLVSAEEILASAEALLRVLSALKKSTTKN